MILATFTMAFLDYNYSWISRITKQPPKLTTFSRRLWKVVAFKSQAMRGSFGTGLIYFPLYSYCEWFGVMT